MVYTQLKSAIEKYPQNIAIQESYGRNITFEKLDVAIHKTEENLRKIGFSVGHKLLVASQNNIDLIATYYAVARIGGIFIPVDPILSHAEFRQMAMESGCDLVMVHESMLAKYPDTVEGKPFDRSYRLNMDLFKVKFVSFHPEKKSLMDGLKGMFSNTKNKKEKDEVKDSEFFHLYSSGSSGKPKGARLTQKNMFYQTKIWVEEAEILSTDKFLVGLPISHSHGITVTFPTLIAGGCVHYVDPMTLLPPRIFDYIEKHQITLISGVPYFFKVLLNYKEDIRGKIKSVRRAFCGSAPMAETLGPEFHAKYGIHINQAFGISEIGIICLNKMKDPTEQYGSVGKVFSSFEYQIVDENNKPVKKGEQGHFILKSPGLAMGYSNAPEEEKKMFIDGWFHTQDIVREDEHGNIYVIGRKSNFINVNGNKVFPAEVEKVILGLTEVKDAAVIGESDADAGEIVKAYVVAPKSLTADIVRAHCLKSLTSFKIPRIIEIVDELPHSSTGKVLYNKIEKSVSTKQSETLNDEDLIAY